MKRKEHKKGRWQGGEGVQVKATSGQKGKKISQSLNSGFIYLSDVTLGK